jgi:p-aminobenzoyl-glutamate transporter AbgT
MYLKQLAKRSISDDDAYFEFLNYCKKHYKAKNSIKEYKPMNEGLALLLFLLLIIPGVIYVSKKRKEKKLIDANNQKMKREMARIIQEGEQYKR